MKKVYFFEEKKIYLLRPAEELIFLLEKLPVNVLTSKYQLDLEKNHALPKWTQGVEKLTSWYKSLLQAENCLFFTTNNQNKGNKKHIARTNAPWKMHITMCSCLTLSFCFKDKKSLNFQSKLQPIADILLTRIVWWR